MENSFANGGPNNCIEPGAIATARQYADLHRLFLPRCNMDFLAASRREMPKDTTGAFAISRKV
jgi:hypothetical protein